MTVSLSFGVITDVVITACMMYYLHKHKSTFRRCVGTLYRSTLYS